MYFATLTQMNVPANLVSTMANVLTRSTLFIATAQKDFLVIFAKWTSMSVPVHLARMGLNALMVLISTHASVPKDTQGNTARLILTSATQIPATMEHVKMGLLHLLAFAALVILAACVRQT